MAHMYKAPLEFSPEGRPPAVEFLDLLVRVKGDKLAITLARTKGYDFYERQPFRLEDIESVRPALKFRPVASQELERIRTAARDADAKVRGPPQPCLHACSFQCGGQALELRQEL